MEVKKLKPNTAYATCNGEYATPVEPIHAFWGRARNDDGDEEIYDFKDEYERGEVPKTDPWAQCHSRAVKSRRPLLGHLGVLMNVYEVDRDGEPVEFLRQSVVKPVDVKGTWLQYLALYAHVVRDAADRKTYREGIAAVESELKERLGAVLGGDVKVDYQTGYATRNRHVAGHLRVSYGADVGDPDDDLLTQLEHVQQVGEELVNQLEGAPDA